MQTLAALNTIGIFLKATDLPPFAKFNVNPNNLYDAFVVIHTKHGFAGTTEVITNSRNPSWTKLLQIEYKFQEKQTLRFRVYYKHPKFDESMIDKHYFLGESVVTLKELVEDNSGYVRRDLKGGKLASSTPAKLMIYSDNLCDITPCNFRCEFQAANLTSPKSATKNFTYIAIQRMFENGNWVTVFKNRSQEFDSYASLAWVPSSCSYVWLCNRDPHATLKFSVFSHQKGGLEYLIGETDETNLMDVIQKHSIGASFELHLSRDDPTVAIDKRRATGWLRVNNPTIDANLPNLGPALAPHSLPVEVLRPLASEGVTPNVATNAVLSEHLQSSLQEEDVPSLPSVVGDLKPSDVSIPPPPLIRPEPLAIDSDSGSDHPVGRLPSIRLEAQGDAQEHSHDEQPHTQAGDTIRDVVAQLDPHVLNVPEIDRHVESLSEQLFNMTVPIVEPADGHDVSFVYDGAEYDQLFKGEVLPTQPVSEYPASTFPNFIKGGCEIGMLFAIDFTLSNDHPRKPIKPLHRLSAESKEAAIRALARLSSSQVAVPIDDGPTEDIDVTDERILEGLNDYQKVILSVGSIIEEYDSDKRFPVMGFGAKLKTPEGKWVVNHCFPLAESQEFEVAGLTGIMDAYNEIQKRIEKSGPTLFAPCLRNCLDFAKAHPCTQENPNYHVLIVITDGCINDRNETVEAIVELARHPVSIIIIGVGEADFSDMVMLDGDEVPLRNQAGEVVSRDIVQFVPFNRFVKEGVDALRDEVLAEIPRQLLDYMKANNIKPRPRAARA